MSLSWLERLQVGIGPSRIDVIRLRAGSRAAVSASHSVEYSVAPGQSGAQAIASALREALASVRGKRIPCAIVLSNTFARYATLPWREELTDPTARAAYARAHLANTYGPAAANWEFVQDDSAYGLPTAVCALERDLLTALRAAVREAGPWLTSVRPYFSAAFNHVPDRLKNRELWLAVAERERLCLAQVSRGSLMLLRAQRVSHSVSAELASMLERELLSAGSAGAGVSLYVFAPEVSPEALTAPQGIDAHYFDSRAYLAPVGGDARYALALA